MPSAVLLQAVAVDGVDGGATGGNGANKPDVMLEGVTVQGEHLL